MILRSVNKPPLLLFEIPRVGEGQATTRPLEHIQGMFGWRFALGVKMLLQRDGRPLRPCGIVLQHQMTSDSDAIAHLC